MQIIVIGIACLDIVNYVQTYPAEDGKGRTVNQEIRTGGNAANTSKILAQLCTDTGSRVCLLSNFGSGSGSCMVMNELSSKRICLDHSFCVFGCDIPSSYITAALDTGSRTIIHHRTLPECDVERVFEGISARKWDWIHFEGRNVEVLDQVLRSFARLEKSHKLKISLEIEVDRDGLVELLRYDCFDIVFFSKDFVKKRNYDSPTDFLKNFSFPESAKVVLPWGEAGKDLCLYSF